MNRDEITRVLIERGASPQPSTAVPDVGAQATTDFFNRFDRFVFPLGNSVLSGYKADQFSERWLFPNAELNHTWTHSFVAGRDVTGVRLLAADVFSLLIDASDPDGELFVDGYDDERGEIVRATGIGLWDWLERLAGLLLESPGSDLSFQSELPGNGAFEAAIWFSEPWDVAAVLEVTDLAFALAGAARFGRDLPKMADPTWVAQTFGGCPEWQQLKFIEALDLLWETEPILAEGHLSAIRSRLFLLSPDVSEGLAALGQR